VKGISRQQLIPPSVFDVKFSGGNAQAIKKKKKAQLETEETQSRSKR